MKRSVVYLLTALALCIALPLCVGIAGAVLGHQRTMQIVAERQAQWQNGFDAGRTGAPATANPYPDVWYNKEKRARWAQGWQEGVKKGGGR